MLSKFKHHKFVNLQYEFVLRYNYIYSYIQLLYRPTLNENWMIKCKNKEINRAQKQNKTEKHLKMSNTV